MSGRLSFADLRRRRQMAGTDDEGTPLPAPSVTSQAAAAATPPVATTRKAYKGEAEDKGKLMMAHLDEHLDGGCQPRFEGEPNRKALQGRAVGSRWFEALPAAEKEEIEEESIVHMHHLMNPNRRPSPYYETPEGKRKKRLEVDYLYEEAGILQAIRRSGEARVYLWYALYFLIFRLWMSTFLLLADIIMEAGIMDLVSIIFSSIVEIIAPSSVVHGSSSISRNAILDCTNCGPQREGAIYALWVYLTNNGLAWLICLVCTRLLPQYDERFNTFHVKIIQLCMIVLLFCGSVTLIFQHYTYNSSKLRLIYEVVNMVLDAIIYALCKISTWITTHEMASLADAIQNQKDHTKRSNMMAEEWTSLKKAMKEMILEKKEKEALWNSPGPRPSMPTIIKR